MNKDALYGNKHLNVRNNKLILDGFDVEEIAKIYGTPTFLFSQQKIKDNLYLIKTIFTELFTHSQGFYSMKANFLQPIIEIVRDNNFGVEVIGVPEMQMLQKISFPSERILAGGPYLSEDLLQSVVLRNVGYLVLYNIDDITQLERVLSSQGNKSQKILLRFQTPKYTSRHGVKVSKESIIEIASILKKCPHVDFQGILSHMGTELNSIKQYMDNIQNLISITKLFHAHSDLPIHVIDIGGGFPNADALKPTLFYNYLRKIKAELNRTGLTGYRLFYEPGRYIVGDTGFCLAKAIAINTDQTCIYLDIGNNYIQKFMKSSLRFYNVSKIWEHPNKPMDIMGYIPSDQDILVRNYNFTPSVEKNDFILIANVGAYALTWSTRFPYSRPSILFFDENQIKLMYDRHSPHDFSL